MKVHRLRLPAALAAAAALFLSALVLPPGAGAQASVTRDSFTIPFEVVRDNPCYGEEVQVTGELDIMVETVVDATGATHATFNLVPHVTAVGAESGIEYKILGGQRNHFNASSQDGSFNITDGFSFNVIGRGPGDNSLWHALLHVTINPQGVETAFVDSSDARCVG